jgi:hypothetical protein
MCRILPFSKNIMLRMSALVDKVASLPILNNGKTPSWRNPMEGFLIKAIAIRDLCHQQRLSESGPAGQATV